MDINAIQVDIPSYVLITPARNEAAYIERTIKSMVSQTVLPLKWVIVSDGSTDGTDDIVKSYAARHKWIEMVRTPERKERHFAGKVFAFDAGYERVKDLKFDVIGNLDADISFDEDYFSFILSKMGKNPELGVAGTPFRDGTVQYDYRFASTEHVSGACQLFRRECFEEIGGYIPIKGGGVDWTAVTTARMKGWRTRTFTEKTYSHHRNSGTGQSTLLASRFRFGKQDYYLGAYPLWEIFRCLYQMKNRPRLLGGLLLISGYIWAFLSRVERPIPRELVRFRQKEQMQRLKNILYNMVSKIAPRALTQHSVVEISVKGRMLRVPSVQIEGKTIIFSGKWLKFASVWDEDWLEGEVIDDPEACINALNKQSQKADIFTFAQKLPNVEPKYNYPMEWDNVAAIRVTSFEHWWHKQIRCRPRNRCRKSERLGVNVRVAEFNDELLQGIMSIYNESPVRQGKPFWHYGKGYDSVKKDNAAYLDRSYFIAAYLNAEMIGYLKLVNNGECAGIMHIMSMIKHRDKAANNALIAKAVEICAQEKIPYLAYGNYIYGKKGADTLTEFKHSSGFGKIDVPRYYIPLTLKGRLALKLGIHRGLIELLPRKLLLKLIELRNKWNEKRYGNVKEPHEYDLIQKS